MKETKNQKKSGDRISQILSEFKKDFDRELEKQFEKELRISKKIHPIAVRLMKDIRSINVAGGKRVRPALAFYAYSACGKKPSKKILRAVMSLDIAHSFLLMHDDIIDRDAKRRGVDTFHEIYRKKAEQSFPQKDTLHYGNSMSIIAGDMLNTIANKVVIEAQLDPKVTSDAIYKLQELVYQVVPGEALDVHLEFRGNATEKEILAVHEWKTAHYTFENPIHFGCILAGRNEPSLLRKWTNYSIPLGIAFQLRDDILGVFGDEKKLGKPVGSDVIEGKETLLVVQARKKGNEKQKQIIDRYLGKEDLTRKELKEFRSLIVETGSLDYSQRMCQKLAEKSLQNLKSINIKDGVAREFFEGIAYYIINRDK